ncbi:MurR/RpiR family transcriptional regulator [Xinfangfangia sp. CPCC 101601]|uniref:MurR/RpiR family transcriptional regulator n=1 Tax=Pseudogemmobacter lacusdianii TaxID=3069608 RepID=A0ABU0W1E2_9RHOB|nr:MurR/RpiR family transcriptional regulator [Xinfangfangia sp. CPCC 101601]MDQ2067802.1 MurR/RpiR family transcriptional regulator [Xinfangfangia sp. CPCC 101601]
MAIRDRLTNGSVQLTPSDLKVARALLADYPAAGLNTVAQLAAIAGVSGPTVVRFVSRLGFDGFPEFQKALLAEVQARMNSPLAMIDAGKATAVPQEQIYQEVIRTCVGMLETTADMVLAAEFDMAARLVSDPSYRLHFIGGRFSGYLAGMLWQHICQLRTDCMMVSNSQPDRIDSLVDIGRRDLIVAFDYRRYQTDTIQYVTASAERGAQVVLFTDPWTSPLAAYAKVVISAPVEGPSPFDTMVPALAQVEALIAAVTTRLSATSRGRIAEIEALRKHSGITEDQHSPLPKTAPESAGQAGD